MRLTSHSLVHLVTGNDAEALRLVLRAEEIEPASLIIRSHVAWTLYYMRRFHEAVDRLERIFAVGPALLARLFQCGMVRRGSSDVTSRH